MSLYGRGDIYGGTDDDDDDENGGGGGGGGGAVGADGRVEQEYAPAGSSRFASMKGSTVFDSQRRAGARARRARLDTIRRRGRADGIRKRRHARIVAANADDAAAAATAAEAAASDRGGAGGDDDGDAEVGSEYYVAAAYRQLYEQFSDEEFLGNMLRMLFYTGSADDEEAAVSAAAAAADNNDDDDGSADDGELRIEPRGETDGPGGDMVAVRLSALQWFRRASSVPPSSANTAGADLCERVAQLVYTPDGAAGPVELVDHIVWLAMTSHDQETICEAAWLAINICRLSPEFLVRVATACGDGSDEFDADGRLSQPTLPRRLCDYLTTGCGADDGDGADELTAHTRAILTRLIGDIAHSSHEAREWCVASGAVDVVRTLLRPPSLLFVAHRRHAELYGVTGRSRGENDDDDDDDGELLRAELDRQEARRSFGEADEVQKDMYLEAVYLADTLVCDLVSYEDGGGSGSGISGGAPAATTTTTTTTTTTYSAAAFGGAPVSHRPDYERVRDPIVCALGELISVYDEPEAMGLALSVLTFEIRADVDDVVDGGGEAAAACRQRTVERVVELSCVARACMAAEQREAPRLAQMALAFMRAITEIANAPVMVEHVFEKVNKGLMLSACPSTPGAMRACASLMADFARASAEYARCLVDDGVVDAMVQMCMHTNEQVREDAALALDAVFAQCTPATLRSAVTDRRAMVRAISNVLAKGKPGHAANDAGEIGHEVAPDAALACCRVATELLRVSCPRGARPGARRVDGELLQLFESERAIETLEQVRDGAEKYHVQYEAEGDASTPDVTINTLAEVYSVCDTMLCLYLASVDDEDGDDDDDDSTHATGVPRQYGELLRQYAGSSDSCFDGANQAAAAAAAGAAAAAAGGAAPSRFSF